MKVRPGIIGKHNGINQAAAFRSTAMNAATTRRTLMALHFVTVHAARVLGITHVHEDCAHECWGLRASMNRGRRRHRTLPEIATEIGNAITRFRFHLFHTWNPFLA
jgi:N-acyl-D-aspartate/D-glutamate deacylase